MELKNVLFLCTGNYYRSRFAELLFNHLALRSRIPWIATSRGLALERGAHNVGPISEAVLAGLALRGVSLEQKARYPLPLSETDLAGSNHIVALKRDEHLPLMQRNFPRWVERVEFWHVHDIDLALPDEALELVERNVRGLIRRLQEGASLPREDRAR